MEFDEGLHKNTNFYREEMKRQIKQRMQRTAQALEAADEHRAIGPLARQLIEQHVDATRRHERVEVGLADEARARESSVGVEEPSLRLLGVERLRAVARVAQSTELAVYDARAAPPTKKATSRKA